MPRKTRMYLPGVPAHIVQRGNNREACFFADEDYQFYKQVLGEGMRRYGGQLHAYCLMTNHVHLLITPEEEDSISRIIQHLGREYVQYVNSTYRRTGTLWEGRHKSSIVDAGAYLLACYRYIELNPVAAHMVEAPEQYSWSSYRCNGLGENDSLVTHHVSYLALSPQQSERLQAYRSLFVSASVNESSFVRQQAERNMPLGDGRFKAQVESMLGRKLGSGKRGRPKNR